ncbi:MAG: recombinase family protein [Pseudomonadota bacterium]
MTKLGPASFGFQRRDGRLMAHPDEAPIRRYVFELFLEHQRKKTVAMILNAEGHRTRSGAEFNGTTIGRLLTEEAAKGIPDIADSLVPHELWQQCNEILKKQRSEGPARRKVSHLFAGLVHCHCNAKMYVPSNTNKYVCATCRLKIPSDDLEALYVHQLAEWLEKDETLVDSNLTSFWSKASFETRRQLIEQSAERIIIDGKKVTFVLFEL